MKLTLSDLKGRAPFRKRFHISAYTRTGAMFQAHGLAMKWFDCDEVFVKVNVLGHTGRLEPYHEKRWRMEMKVMNSCG